MSVKNFQIIAQSRNIFLQSIQLFFKFFGGVGISPYLESDTQFRHTFLEFQSQLSFLELQYKAVVPCSVLVS